MTPPRDLETTLFEDAIDVPSWLESDRTTPFPERLQRDRAIARTLVDGDAVSRVRAWWRRLEVDERPETGRRLDAARTLVTLAMLVIGALAGIGVALAAFRYDGTYPVNVVRLLALLVAPQLVLVALTLLMLPPRVPGLRLVQDALATLNPGALAEALFRRLAPTSRNAAELLGVGRGRTASGRFAKWQMLTWSQASAVAFNVAALVTAFLLITFTDLAFGWSTTLALDAADVRRIVETLAWPWHDVAPAAVPSLELIERSQFFRLESLNGFETGASRDLTGWWSFTVLAIACYGLVPRVVLLAFSAWRLRVATRALLVDDPRVAALLDRMAAPAIETAADEHETAGDDEARTAAPAPALGGPARGVIWSHGITRDAVYDYARRRLGLELTALVEAGGSPELDVDRRAADEIAAGAGPLVVFTPAWEPPLLEFLDFLTALRERAGPDASIVVAPVAEEAKPADEVERDTWARAVGRLADPRVYVETGAA